MLVSIQKTARHQIVFDETPQVLREVSVVVDAGYPRRLQQFLRHGYSRCPVVFAALASPLECVHDLPFVLTATPVENNTP